jgi:hypothetical protein
MYVARVNQHYLEAALFKDFVERNPVDPGRFHRHGLDSALGQPVGQANKLCGEGAKLAYRFGVALDWNRHEVTSLAAVDTGGVRLDALE